MKPALPAISLVIMLVLAGCGGNDSEATTQTTRPPAGEARFSDTTGAIDGVVTDEELNPVAGATIGIQGAQLTAQSDAHGRFIFSELDPGTYTLFAQALGYQPQARRVDVLVGQAVSVQFKLVPIATPLAEYTRTWIQRGLLGCAVEAGVGFSACGAIALAGNLAGQNMSSFDQFLLNWEINEPTAAWNASVFEMQWRSTQALGSGLLMIWEIQNCPNDPKMQFAMVEGRSPLHAYAEGSRVAAVVEAAQTPNNCDLIVTSGDTSDQCTEDFCNLQSRVFSAAETTGQAVDVGVTIQQPFEQFLTNFYNHGGAPDFSAIESG